MFMALCIASALAFASPSGVVISGFQTRGPAGGNDEYVEIRNATAANVDISGWKLQGCAAGTPGNASNRATVGLMELERSHPFANINLTDNVVRFVTSRYDQNPLVVQGPGAGPAVTAGGVFADLLRVCSYLGAKI